MAVAIRTEGLAKYFGDVAALRPLDLDVGEGEVLGYLGPNGAGKTTTIRCLLGLIRASAGRAEIFGVDAQAQPAEAHRRLAFVPGEANLWPGLTGGETLHLLGPRLRNAGPWGSRCQSRQRRRATKRQRRLGRRLLRRVGGEGRRHHVPRSAKPIVWPSQPARA